VCVAVLGWCFGGAAPVDHSARALREFSTKKAYLISKKTQFDLAVLELLSKLSFRTNHAGRTTQTNNFGHSMEFKQARQA
jgi:hypothetical protein